MRVMVLVKATEDSEAGLMPEPGMLEAMGRFNEELIKAGVIRRAKDGVRIIGGGEFKAKLSITAAGASKPAIAAVEKAGGSITLPAPKDSEA